MKSNSGFLRGISIISIIFLIISLGIFAYSRLNEKNIDSMKKENVELKSNLEIKDKEENDIKYKYNLKEQNMKEILSDFATKYGYDFQEGEDSIKSKVIEGLKEENNNILAQMTLEIKKYKNYYTGDYYNSETYIDAVNSFSKLSSIKATESLSSDLYEDISLDYFIQDAKKTGTIAYLSKVNKNSKNVNVMLFITALYSKKLNDIVLDENNNVKNVDEVYTAVLNFVNIYKNLEKYGLYTGDLPASKLMELKNQVSNLDKKYYENLGVIEILNKGDNNETNK